jgi:hypothetical protein
VCHRQAAIAQTARRMALQMCFEKPRSISAALLAE